MIGGQSSQDGDQLSATLKRLEVRPVNIGDACGMSGGDVQNNNQQSVAGALPYRLLWDAWKLADGGLIVGLEGRKRSGRARLGCC